MPKSSSQSRADIVCVLKEKKYGTITQEQLDDAMIICGVEAPASRRTYIKMLVAQKYLERTKGGYKLTYESERTAEITIKISPTHSLIEITKAVNDALRRFGKAAVVEVKL